ncbi:hypothetical protein Bbelb_025510 [Branchiostoma belcheri]|nr:hypothetical protein Bbelb_025510 [Branchiostoma belcheri]
MVSMYLGGPETTGGFTLVPDHPPSLEECALPDLPRREQRRKLAQRFSRPANTRCDNEDEQPPPSDPSRLLAVFRAVAAGTQPICRTLGNRWTGTASPAAGNYDLLTPLLTYQPDRASDRPKAGGRSYSREGWDRG